jgi:hypothetical protein
MEGGRGGGDAKPVTWNGGPGSRSITWEAEARLSVTGEGDGASTVPP